MVLREGDYLDLIRMYNAADYMREYIWSFNLIYERQYNDKWKYLLPAMDELGAAGESDKAYWEDTKIDFCFWKNQVNDIEKALAMGDIVYIYDKLNFEIRWFIKCVLDVMFEKNFIDLQKWFWNENREAMKKRYPEVLEQIEKLDSKKNEQYIRDYGLRGKVIYRKHNNLEYDLYSGYSPVEVGNRIMRETEFKRYNYIYIWGFNGGYEIAGGDFCFERTKKFEVYITDLFEFKQIIFNTMRKGILLDPNINWIFNKGLRDFFNSINKLNREETYIYVTENCLEKELISIRKYVETNSINCNIG